jgi:hypothetical protein
VLSAIALLAFSVSICTVSSVLMDCPPFSALPTRSYPPADHRRARGLVHPQRTDRLNRRGRVSSRFM